MRGNDADDYVRAVATEWREANGLSPADAALCRYAEKLTRTPASMTEADVVELRAAGFDDRGIHDAVQVIAYFNYINRVADSLNVDLEAHVRPWDEPSD